ncbi:cellulose binding domain-containing protein [Allonocardiopsis opalescens]|uniref:Cellulose binding domain-containing protein n=1 Tax=Allonocardiopsis opalescens TaxID=1144618 RepID=A0A2T0PVT6_9ACTN|nr:cellulose binding domain-containing protein [Allonocardiopsis opalescens]PRX95643.1 cellulose binding domain-containing protein [Allonocardiopsis opalescens]
MGRHGRAEPLPGADEDAEPPSVSVPAERAKARTARDRSRRPRLAGALLSSGLVFGLLLLAYSTSHIYLRFTNAPLDGDSSYAMPGAVTGPESSPGLSGLDQGASAVATPSAPASAEPSGEPSPSAEPEQDSGGAPEGQDTEEPDDTPRPDPRSTSAGEAQARPVVSYSVVDDWWYGFQGQLVITNQGDRALDGWNVTVRLDDAYVNDLWGADEWDRERDGFRAGAGGRLDPGETAVIGFNASGDGPELRGCTINGAGC